MKEQKIMTTSWKCLALIIPSIFLLSGCGTQTPEEKLEEECRALTTASSEGHVYEAIIAYVGQGRDQITRVVNHSVAGTTRGYSIIFIKDDKKFDVYSGGIQRTGKNREADEMFQNYTSIIEEVISTHKEEPNFKNYVFGICAYKQRKNHYRGEMETLSLISKGE